MKESIQNRKEKNNQRRALADRQVNKQTATQMGMVLGWARLR